MFLKTPFAEVVGAFSPDGRWVAYQQTNESGGSEIYVRPFVPPSPQASADEPGTAGATVPAGASGRCPRPVASFPSGDLTARSLLRHSGGRDDGRADQSGRNHTRTGCTDDALSHAHRRRWWGAGRPELRRRPRRALPHQHGTTWRRRADHAHPELESGGAKVALLPQEATPWSRQNGLPHNVIRYTLGG